MSGPQPSPRGRAIAGGARLGLVLAVLGTVACRRAADELRRERDRLAEAAAAPTPELPAPPPPTGPLGLRPGRYRLLELAVAVKASGPAGLPWDLLGGAAPDLRAVVKIDGEERARCDGPSDALLLQCALDTDVSFDRSSRVTVQIFDRDDLADELIGGGRLAPASAGRLDAAMVFEVDGAVAAAQLTVGRAPSRWSGRRRQGLAAGIGALAALAIVFGLRRVLVRAAVPLARVGGGA